MNGPYNLFDPRTRANPYPFYKNLRDNDPVQFIASQGMWFLSRHADCVAALRDPRFSAKEAHRLRQRAVELAPSMLNCDPPEHTRLRTAAGRAWNPAALNETRPGIQAAVDHILSTLDGCRQFDVVADFANPVAAQTLAIVLGIPSKDCTRLHHWLTECSGNIDPLASPKDQEKGAAAAARMRRYFAGLSEERRHDPQRDILSALVQAQDRQDSLSSDELLETLNLLLIGGYEPLVNLIGNGVLALLRHPEELKRLRMDSALTKSAVEELLRFDTPIPFVARIAREHVLIGGHLVRKGQLVVPLLGAANRDPAVFDDPDRLDLSREPNPHLTFGTGSHVCFGAFFARSVGQIAIAALVQHFPNLQLAIASPEWRSSIVPRGLAALPVACA
jgi:cytochrome P450